jgi:large subunit ribosomal protein L3
MKFALTQKIGMSRVFDQDGKMIPVTLLKLKKAEIIRVKTKDSNDGYDSCVVKVVSDSKNAKNNIFEFRVENPQEYKVGDTININQFSEKDLITVESKTKGKGFAGTIKRHGFHRGPVTHGSHNIRKPGSIGGGYPQRVVPGKKMAGRMGGQNSTIKNLEIVSVDAKEEMIMVAGSVSGSNNSTVKVYSK